MLNIVEILERILSYIDEFYIRRTVIFVCQQWFQLVRKRVVREVFWDTRWDSTTRLETVLAQLPGAGRLTCYCMRGTDEGFLTAALFSAMKTYMPRYLAGVQVIRADQLRSSVMFYSPLRELSLSCGSELRNLDAFPFPPTVISLNLTLYHNSAAVVDISILLKKCPLLESLSLFRSTSLTIDGPWIPNGHDDTQLSLPLRSLVLKNTSFIQSRLEDFLAITSKLHQLKLVDANPRFQQREQAVPAIVVYDWKRLVDRVRTLGIKLDSFHMSLPGQYITNTAKQQDMVRVCQGGPNEWTLWAPDVNEALLQELVSLPNFVTSVELCGDSQAFVGAHPCARDSSTTIPRLLHRYLCESPHLRHLEVLRSPFLLEAMDYHSRGGHLEPKEDNVQLPMSTRHFGWEYDDEWPDDLPGIWACRGLLSLKLEMHSHRRYMLKSGLHSRILFGYISRVCPMLEDLEITLPYECSHGYRFDAYRPELSLRLEGGLCLLSRLKHLRRLQIYNKTAGRTINYGEVDLNWLVPEGHQPRHKEKREQALRSWGDAIGEEARRERLRLESGQVLRYRMESVQGAVDSELIQQLENLGLLTDVTTMLEEMNVPGFECLPNLERLSFSKHLARKPLDAIRQVIRS